MCPLIDAHRDEICVLCRRHYVRRLELFGSAAGDSFDTKRSDLDFLVEFTGEPGHRPFADFFDLLHGLQSLFGRDVDLVIPSAIRNPVFRQAIDKQRRVVYAA